MVIIIILAVTVWTLYMYIFMDLVVKNRFFSSIWL